MSYCVWACRYGPDAAEITGHATEMATQSATAAMRLRTGGVKTIAQRVARHTALGFARQAVYGPGKQGGQGQPPSKPGARPQVSIIQKTCLSMLVSSLDLQIA